MMNKWTLLLASMLAAGACSIQTETPAADGSPSASEAIDSVDNGPPPPADPVVAGSGDAELEAAIRATDPAYTIDAIGADGRSQKARYATARADLDGDGNPEVFVYLMGSYFCGSGGCSLLVFSQGMDGYKLLADIPTSDPPVILADTGTNGFKDFWRLQSGGGGPAEYVRHGYENGQYIEKSRKPASEKPAGTELLGESIDFARGIELEPRRN